MDRKQQRNNKGLAPFASVEDLSDDSPPDDKCRLTLPGIREDGAGAGAGAGTGGGTGGGLTTPAHRAIAPRIDISRASSSSHHDDSSPERELFGGTDGANLGTKYDLGFSEEMALELRSSTEELDFQDPTENETKARRKKLQQQQAVTKYELEAQSEKEVNERKDSGCSEGGLLLSISGRTSRLSSIGSAASGGSAASHGSAQSHLSGASHLSAVSNYSKASRCSSPHRMMLETSFCGPKPIPTVSLEAEYPPKESVEAALLARKSDPTGAVLPPEESINITRHNSTKIYGGKSTLDVKPKPETKPRAGSERISRSEAQNRSGAAESKHRSRPRDRQDDLVRIIPLHGSLDEPEEAVPRRPSPSPPLDGIYIPLKGPEIDPRTVDAEYAPARESDLVKFISLHGDDDHAVGRKSPQEPAQPNCRNSHTVHFKHLPQHEKNRAHTGRDKHAVNKSKTGDSEGSGETKTKKESKNKSVFTSLFKKTPKEKESHAQKCPEKVTYDSKITNVEFKFNQEVVPIDKDTIIIPLHSPDSIIEPLDLNYKQEERETKNKDQPIEPPPMVNRTETQATKNKLVPQSLEKNVVIVDVINEDNKESSSTKVERHPMVSSPLQNELKLEHFETEPKVLKSVSSTTTTTEGASVEMEADSSFGEPPPPVKHIPERLPQEEELETKGTNRRVVESNTGGVEQETHRSSESEVDSEIGQVGGAANNAEEGEEEDDYERKGLFHQTDSIEEELPYVPTTLPQERSVAVPIVPVRERLAQVKTCPIERPRSTTPINPSTLDKYAASHDDPSTQLSQSEKMQITLPRSDSIGKSKSPGRSKQPWMQFAEQCLQSPKEGRKMRPPSPNCTTPPPLPPRGATPQTTPWVSFDELPERKRAPKRITTLPIRPSQHQLASNIVYSYVNPEECSCECHENQGKLNNSHCQSDKGHCSYSQQDGRTEREKHFRS